VGGTNPALLQALGCGAPTVAFDSVFNREVLGNDAHLFSSDVEALAELINSIMSSSALQARLRAVGRNRVADAYRWTDVCEAYASLLERCAR
jgi:glycosyltransferase involved in cell wall biosynthesis